MSVMLVLKWLLSAFSAAVGSCAFAVIFHSPKNQIIPAGLVGGFGWLVYLVLVHYGLSPVWSSFFATVGLAYLSRTMSYIRKCPTSIFLIVGIFPLVPGIGIYNTSFSLFEGSNTFMTLGLQTVETAIAISLGMGFVFSLPSILFFRGKQVKSK